MMEKKTQFNVAYLIFALLAMLLANPLQVFKLSAIYSLRATLDTLGPVGQYAAFQFGGALPVVLVALLALVTALAGPVASACTDGDDDDGSAGTGDASTAETDGGAGSTTGWPSGPSASAEITGVSILATLRRPVLPASQSA